MSASTISNKEKVIHSALMEYGLDASFAAEIAAFSQKPDYSDVLDNPVDFTVTVWMGEFGKDLPEELLVPETPEDVKRILIFFGIRPDLAQLEVSFIDTETDHDMVDCQHCGPIKISAVIMQRAKTYSDNPGLRKSRERAMASKTKRW